MAPPFSVPPNTLVINLEDDGRATTDQGMRDMFTKDVQRRLELIRRRRSLQLQPQPPPAPPVQQAPLPLPLPPPPPPPAQHPSAKRPAIEPPPGFADVRTPPLKYYQRRSPRSMVSAQQSPHQPAPPNAHCSPGRPAPNAQRAAGHPLQPAAAAGAHGVAAMAVLPVPVHAPGPITVPALQRRMAPKPKPTHPAAKKKPTVPCTFCGVLCMTAWHLKQHEQGRKHRNRVAYLAGEMNVRCEVCNVHLSSELNIQQHNAGKQHLLRLHKGA